MHILFYEKAVYETGHYFSFLVIKVMWSLHSRAETRNNVYPWERRQRDKKHVLTVQRAETKRDQDGFWDSHVITRSPKKHAHPPQMQGRQLFLVSLQSY